MLSITLYFTHSPRSFLFPASPSRLHKIISFRFRSSLPVFVVHCSQMHAGISAEFLPLDLSDDTSIVAAKENVERNHKKLDVSFYSFYFTTNRSLFDLF